MVTSREALEAALRDVVDPVVRAAGFQGAPDTWRRMSEAGDWAVVNVQLAGTAQSVQCAINLAVVPEPWLEFMSEWLGRPPARVNESLGLYRERLEPTGSAGGVDGAWSVGAPGEAEAVAADMAGRLREHGLPLLDRLLDREQFLASLRAGDLGMLKAEHFTGVFAFAEAVLISDEGPGERLEELLRISWEQAEPDRKASAERYGDWIRRRAKTRHR